jgi:hypothetical protein
MDPQPLECATIVYRALRASADLDRAARRVNRSAFLRREATDLKGLSVNYNCPTSECGKELRKRYGVATLHVGHIRSLELDVVADQPAHANIIGVPLRDLSKPETVELAERLADKLAEHARALLLEELT